MLYIKAGRREKKHIGCFRDYSRFRAYEKRYHSESAERTLRCTAHESRRQPPFAPAAFQSSISDVGNYITIEREFSRARHVALASSPRPQLHITLSTKVEKDTYAMPTDDYRRYFHFINISLDETNIFEIIYFITIYFISRLYRIILAMLYNFHMRASGHYARLLKYFAIFAS